MINTFMLNFRDWSETIFKLPPQPMVTERPPAPLQDVIDFKPISNYRVYTNALSRLDSQLRPLMGSDKQTEDTAKYHVHQAIEWLKQYGDFMSTKHLRVG